MSEYDFERTPATFDMLYEAVSATPRGRWFLDEFAKRNRTADTEQLLCELARLGETRSGTAQDNWVRLLRRDVEALQAQIDAARGEFATIRPDDDASPADDFGALAAGIERASKDIRLAGARLLELVKRIRDGECDVELSLVIEDAAATLFLVSSLEEVAGRRAKTVVGALERIDQRLEHLLSRLGPVDDPAEFASEDTPQKNKKVERKTRASKATVKTETRAISDTNVVSIAREDADETLPDKVSQDTLDALLR